MIALIITLCFTVSGLCVVVVKLANRNEELYDRIQKLDQRERDRQALTRTEI